MEILRDEILLLFNGISCKVKIGIGLAIEPTVLSVVTQSNDKSMGRLYIYLCIYHVYMSYYIHIHAHYTPGNSLYPFRDGENVSKWVFV